MVHAIGPRSSARRCAHARVALVLALLASTCVSAAASPAGDGTDVSAPICAAEATTGEDTTCDAPRMDAADTNEHGRLTGISTATEFLADRYVVRFDDYAPIEAHYASLVESLGPPVNKVDGVMGVKDTKAGAERGADGDTAVHPGDTAKVRWEWVVRDNPATRRFPTDFAVIKLGDDANDDAIDDAKMTAEPRVESISSRGRIGADHKGAKASRIIGAMRGVRDVRREQKLTRSLAWEKGEGPPNDHDDDSTNDANDDHHSSPSSDESPDARVSPGVDPTSGGLRWGDGGEDVNGVPNRATRRRRERLANADDDKENQFGSRHGGGGGPAPGRLRTRPTIGMEPPGYTPDTDSGGLYHDDQSEDADATRGRSLLAARHVVDAFDASSLWKEGFSGKGVKAGIFDTGVKADHPHFRKIKERTNWTHERTLNDGLGHGTFVAGVVASQDGECPGFAPDAEIHTFRVFTNDQVSYTSWFLDAFNYAIATEVNVINLSIGGPDYLDLPFVEKIDEIVANGIIMVSAIGNDGPLYGTLNNPADQLDVIGVGGIDYRDKIASFSSRGMSTHELPHGYGRVKPDIVAYGRDVMGSKIAGGCRSLSGTSVASPVVAGAVTLLASVVPRERRWEILNPGVMKQALVEGADVIAGGPMIYEQGAGKLNLHASREILRDYTPRASLVPGSLDFTKCPYMWPHCRQAVYHGAMPFMFNATIVNGMGLTGWLESPPVWKPSGGDTSASNGDVAASGSDLGAHVDVRFEFSDVLWPYSGYLAFYARVKPTAKNSEGIASGTISFTVLSPPGPGETELRRSTVNVPVKFQVIPTPPRAKRVLWSQYHSVRYPPGYIPRDNLEAKNDILDWHGDHPHTNYHGMYDALRDKGYFLEILGSPLTCFDAKQYGALMLVDPEEEYSDAEVKKLRDDVVNEGLGVFVVGDWYNVKQMEGMRFFDDNTHSHWTPVTGGANVPALNDLLKPFGFAFGDRILNGAATMNGQAVAIASGANIARAPAGAYLHKAFIADKAPKGAGSSSAGGKAAVSGGNGNKEHAVAAFFQAPGAEPTDSQSSTNAKSVAGRLAVYGDSNCLDSSHTSSPCFPFMANVLEFLTENVRDTGLTSERNLATEPFDSGDDLPSRRTDVDFDSLSTTRGGEPGNEGLNRCGPNAPVEFWTTSGNDSGNEGENADAKTSIGWSEERAKGAMVEAKRRLDAVLARRDALVNHEGGRSPVVVDVDDDSHSDLDGGSHHRVNTHTDTHGSGSDTHGADDDDFFAKGVGPFDDAAHGQGGYGTPSIGDSDAAGGQSSAATWIAAALFAVFAALAIRKVRKRRRAKRKEGNSPLASRLSRRHAL